MKFFLQELEILFYILAGDFLNDYINLNMNKIDRNPNHFQRLSTRAHKST